MMGEKPSSWDLIRLLFIMPLPDTVSIPTTKNLPKPLSQFAAGMKTLTRCVQDDAPQTDCVFRIVGYVDKRRVEGLRKPCSVGVALRRIVVAES